VANEEEISTVYSVEGDTLIVCRSIESLFEPTVKSLRWNGPSQPLFTIHKAS
jgi:hypothetical protein